MEFTSKLRTCFWFENNGQDAAEFYVSLFPDSRIDNLVASAQGRPPLVVEFTLCGVPMMVLNGGPTYKLTPAISISVLTEDQTETDHLWNVLCQGGSESMCGWLIDRFGMSWQIVPRALPRLLSSGDSAAAGRVQAAMMQMKKIDIAALEAAYEGTS